MTGEDSGSDPTDGQSRVPPALRDRITSLFVEYRGYEPASFQESLSLVADLAAAQVELESDAPDDAINAGGAGRSVDGPFAEDGPVDGQAADEQSDAIDAVTAEVTDDVADDAFEPLDQQPQSTTGTGAGGSGTTQSAAGTAGSSTAGASTDDADATDDGDARTANVSSLDDGGIDAEGAGTLHADPESSCALCGEMHRVSVLQTTILDGTGSVALICPDCVE